MPESGIPTMFVELQRTETENFARNCAGFACFSETADTAQVSGTRRSHVVGVLWPKYPVLP